MRFFLALLFLVVGVQGYAVEFPWKSNDVLVEPNSVVQDTIDALVVDIFRSPVGQTLCDVYKNTYSVYHSLGVSEQAARTAFSGCTERAGAPSKTLRKQYYLSFSNLQALDSWTDYGNRTYLFVDENLNREKLRSMLLHEIAISLDAKTNLLYSTYIRYFFKGSGLTSESETLKNAFNQSTWKPLSLTFATLRAFHFELYYHSQSPIMTHAACAHSVREVLRHIKKIPSAPRGRGAEDLSEIMADTMSRNFTPQSESHEKNILEQLLSDRFLIQNTQGETVTFCQFMTEPVLSGRSLYSFYGTGPRPRLTGGSGGQGAYVSPWEQLQADISSKKLGVAPSNSDLQLQKSLEQIKERFQVVNTEKTLKELQKSSFPKDHEKD